VARRGRPPRDWRWLVHDVDCVREQRDCSILDACGYLADGAFSETLHVSLPANVIAKVGDRVFFDSLGPCKVVWGKWKGMNVRTLERKYFLAKAGLNGRRPKKSD
jgi:hypothetical protein